MSLNIPYIAFTSFFPKTLLNHYAYTLYILFKHYVIFFLEQGALDSGRNQRIILFNEN